MLTFDKITASVREIADEYPLKKVSIFGSYSDGTNNVDIISCTDTKRLAVGAK